MTQKPEPGKTAHLQATCRTDPAVMKSSHGKCSLYLQPAQPLYTATPVSTFISALQQTGLIAKRIESQHDSNAFFSGDKYLDYIAYMGCAPAIQFEASAHNDDFCFIKIHQYPTAELIHSQKQARAPHCPACNKAVKNWQHTKTSTSILCQHCNTTSAIETFNWRKMAGYGRLFIEITDIFPKEALPQPLLLYKLAQITGTDWLYFYSCR